MTNEEICNWDLKGPMFITSDTVLKVLQIIQTPRSQLSNLCFVRKWMENSSTVIHVPKYACIGPMWVQSPAWASGPGGTLPDNLPSRWSTWRPATRRERTSPRILEHFLSLLIYCVRSVHIQHQILDTQSTLIAILLPADWESSTAAEAVCKMGFI